MRAGKGDGAMNSIEPISTQPWLKTYKELGVENRIPPVEESGVADYVEHCKGKWNASNLR